MNYLVVGGSSVAGQETIAAIREFDDAAYIISTTSTENDVANCDSTIHQVDLMQPESAPGIIARNIKDKIDYLFFLPAYGKVGFPVKMATKEDADFGIEFSLLPLLRIRAAVKPKVTVAFSGFYWLSSLQNTYGGLAFAKLAMDRIAEKYPDQFKVIRAGMFESKSVKGLSLIFQRAITRDLIDDKEYHAYKNDWKASGQKFRTYFNEYSWNKEKVAYRDSFEEPFRPTEASDIRPQVKQVLQGSENPFFNVIGDWSWVEAGLPKLPDYYEDMMQQFYPHGFEVHIKEPLH